MYFFYVSRCVLSFAKNLYINVIIYIIEIEVLKTRWKKTIENKNIQH